MGIAVKSQILLIFRVFQHEIILSQTHEHNQLVDN